MKHVLIATIVCAAGTVIAAPIIDFEAYDDTSAIENGRQLDSVNGLWGGGLVSVNAALSSADLTNGGSRVGIFDSSDPGPNDAGGDPDLLVNLGNIVILQNDGGSFLTQGTSGIYDTPNDDPSGGNAVFDFSAPSELDTIDLVDINGNGALTLTLLDDNGLTRTYDVPDKWTFDIDSEGPDGYDTLDLKIITPQNGEGTGGDATGSEDAGFNSARVIRMSIAFSGSAGLDNIVFVPGPGSIAALTGLGMLGIRRRRRNA